MKRLLSLLILLSSLLLMGVAQAERIKDIASVAGVRSNQLIGYGIVVGLDGTGDKTSQTPFTIQSVKSMLSKFGVTLPANVNPQLKNVAAVSVSASLPPFAKPGQNIDVTVSSIGNSTSLRGGALIMTPLKGADGEVYAIAQGNLVVGGFGASGGDGSRLSVNVPSVGRIPNGASIERGVPMKVGGDRFVDLNLHRADFTTANNVAEEINKLLGEGIAVPLDAASIQVAAPVDLRQRVAFLSVLENLEVQSAQAPARVIINSRTGTVVIGSNVKVDAAAVSHGSLTVTIVEQPAVSQPGAFSGGETVVVGATDIEVKSEGNRMFVFDPGVSLDELVRAVNNVGTAPGDLVAILEALKEAGALRAELVVI